MFMSSRTYKTAATSDKITNRMPIIGTSASSENTITASAQIPFVRYVLACMLNSSISVEKCVDFLNWSAIKRAAFCSPSEPAMRGDESCERAVITSNLGAIHMPFLVFLDDGTTQRAPVQIIRHLSHYYI